MSKLTPFFQANGGFLGGWSDLEKEKLLKSKNSACQRHRWNVLNRQNMEGIGRSRSVRSARFSLAMALRNETADFRGKQLTKTIMNYYTRDQTR